MDIYFHTNKAVNFIESHLYTELRVEQIAENIHFSLAHLYRIFHRTLGISVKEYIRKRRLCEAASSLLTTQKRIIDIAVECQFRSQASFSRAFEREYGISPGRCRRTRIELPLFERPISPIKSESTNQPRIILMNKLLIAGMEFITPLQENISNQTVSKFWKETLAPKLRGMSNASNTHRFPALEQYDSRTGELYHFGAIEVKNLTDLPTGITTKKVSAHKYAVFSNPCNTLNKNGSTVRYAYDTWLPQSGYELAQDFHIGFFQPGKMELYIPIGNKTRGR